MEYSLSLCRCLKMERAVDCANPGLFSRLIQQHFAEHPECLAKALNHPVWRMRRPLPKDYLKGEEGGGDVKCRYITSHP